MPIPGQDIWALLQTKSWSAHQRMRACGSTTCLETGVRFPPAQPNGRIPILALARRRTGERGFIPRGWTWSSDRALGVLSRPRMWQLSASATEVRSREETFLQNYSSRVHWPQYLIPGIAVEGHSTEHLMLQGRETQQVVATLPRHTTCSGERAARFERVTARLEGRNTRSRARPTSLASLSPQCHGSRGSESGGERTSAEGQ